jgi:hypothetical protein
MRGSYHVVAIESGIGLTMPFLLTRPQDLESSIKRLTVGHELGKRNWSVIGKPPQSAPIARFTNIVLSSRAAVMDIDDTDRASRRIIIGRRAAGCAPRPRCPHDKIRSAVVPLHAEAIVHVARTCM